jgi:hypothetical protein
MEEAIRARSAIVEDTMLDRAAAVSMVRAMRISVKALWTERQQRVV